jgi:hypothetical protein
VDYGTTFVDEFHPEFHDPKSPLAISLATDATLISVSELYMTERGDPALQGEARL